MDIRDKLKKIKKLKKVAEKLSKEKVVESNEAPFNLGVKLRSKWEIHLKKIEQLVNSGLK